MNTPTAPTDPRDDSIMYQTPKRISGMTKSSIDSTEQNTSRDSRTDDECDRIQDELHEKRMDELKKVLEEERRFDWLSIPNTFSKRKN